MRGEGTAAAPLRPRDPQRLGRYDLLGRLGEGGMGTVYLGRTEAGALVAIKVVRFDLAPDEEFRRRFRSEVDRVRQVPPFCTAEVLDADPDHETPYLVTEYVDGPNLAEAGAARGPLTASNLHGLAIGVATALTAIHGAGVIHRDLKPRNVLLAPGSPKVIDFGIAKALEGNTAHTRTDQMVGTVAYMAPERFGPDASATITPAADVFAWGAVVAYAGTGRTPFQADSPTATAARILTQPPDLSGLPGPLRDLIGTALEKDPAHRPDARELLDLLVSAGPQPSAAAFARQPGLRAAAQGAKSTPPPKRHPAEGAGPPPRNPYPDPGTPLPERYPADDVEAFRGPALTGRRPRRRVLLPALVAVLLLVLAGGAAVLMRGDLPGAWSAPTSQTASSPADDPSPAPALRRAAVLTDALTGARNWQPSRDAEEKAACAFGDDALRVTRAAPGSFRCRGPVADQPDDLQVEVNVRLLTEGSCAAIWFRFRPYQGYQVRVCETAVIVGTHKSAEVRAIETFPLDKPVPVGGAATRITLTTRGATAEVARDGRPVGTVPLADPEIAGGRVVLGLFTEPGGGGREEPYEVAFDHVDFYRIS